jgi:pyruvate/2-oxoacid:ferredoxin oxidoreductase alpha subunit
LSARWPQLLEGGSGQSEARWRRRHGPRHDNRRTRAERLQQAVRRARADGADVSHIHIRYLWPFPNNLGTLLRSYQRILVPEMNTGQLKTVLRDQYLVDARPLNKVTGQPFMIAEIAAAIAQALASGVRYECACTTCT